MVDTRQISTLFLLQFMILGAFVKLGPIPVLDEIAIIVFTIFILFFLKNYNFYLKFTTYNILIFWIILLSFIGFFNDFNFNALRFIFVFLAILLTNDHLKFSGEKLVNISWFILIINLLIPIYGFIQDYEIAWWQNFLWTGTAYAAIPIYFCASIIIYYNKSIWKNLTVITLVVLISILTLSKLLAMSCFLIILGSILNLKGFKKIQYLGISASLLTIGYFQSEDLRDIIDSIVITLQFPDASLIGYADGERDEGRKLQNLASFMIFEYLNIFSLSGYGILGHQTELLKYLPPDSSGIIRPVGLPAITFDGGFILFFLIILNSILSIWKILQSFRFDIEKIFFRTTVLLFFIFSISVTNTFDMLIWWIVIKPGNMNKFFK